MLGLGGYLGVRKGLPSFVVETKSGLFMDDLRDAEGAKIACGKAHFEVLRAAGSSVEYKVARTLDDVFSGS